MSGTTRASAARAAACFLVLLVSAAAHASPHAFSADGIEGTVDREGDAMTTVTRMHVDRPPHVLLAALTDYAHIGRWMPDTVEYKVVKQDGLNGRFWRKSRAPMLVPDPYATVDCSAQVKPDGTGRVTWHRLDGTIKVFDATFDLEPEGTGTRVTYGVRISVPFPVPWFILKRAGPPAILDTMRGLRREAMARPVTPAPVPPPAAPVTDGGVAPSTGDDAGPH